MWIALGLIALLAGIFKRRKFNTVKCDLTSLHETKLSED